MSRIEANMHPVAGPHWKTALWLLGPALVLTGLTVHGVWRALPWERFALSLVLAAVAALVAWPLARFARWRWASALAAVWCAALVLYAGPLPILATALIAIASLALGLRWIPTDVPGRIAIAAVSGYAVIAGIAGWLVSLPLHFAVVWMLALALPIALNRNALKSQWQTTRIEWRAFADASPKGAAAAVMLLGLASTGAWLPTMQMDDLTYHLNLPAQLAQHARYLADPAHGAWVYAPWMGDVGQGLAWLLAGREARGAVNAFWLVSAAIALAGAARALGAAPVERIAILALFASFPPLVWLMAGMQTELPAMAVLFSLVALVLHDRSGRHLAAMTLLMAALAALKPMHALAALPLLAYATRYAPGRLLRSLPMLAVLWIAIAGSSYAHAWWHTGNPVFPLFNAVFRSPHYPLENMSDTRWLTGFGPALPWRMTFESSRFVEAWDGGIGFLWIGLAGAWLLALCRPATRAFACIAACIALLPLVPMQYARYAFPGLLLLLLPALSGSRADVGRRVWRWPIVMLCVLSLAYQANAGWTHHSAALKRAVRAPGAPDAVLPYYVAERTLIARLPADDMGVVLATDPQRGHVAELAGRGRLMSIHAPALAAAREAADRDGSGEAWRSVFEQLDARWILMTEDTASPALMQALTDDPAIEHVESVQGIALWQRTSP
ncbi:hypothetical protein LDO31_11150 [Luteimonas sp. XNQY3]|nr:hypothetical protein [Luteimonas sp. XNQY3]MCD9006782.1 hypothetical protein [Luteimonas sp. XNQY3]